MSMLINKDNLDYKVRVLFNNYNNWLREKNLEDNMDNFLKWYSLNNLDIYNLK